MSSATTRLSIPFVKSSEALPTCKPNLMPFHIQYTGPAEVSAYMRIEKFQDEADTGSSPVATGTSTPTLLQVVAPLEMESSKMDVEDGAIDTPASSIPEGSADVDMAPPSLTRTNTEASVGMDPALEPSASTSTSTLSAAPSSSSLGISAVTSQTSLATSVSTSSLPQMQAPPIEDIERRVVSSFRGRTIHGLEIDIPKGYVGLVLKTENILPSRSDATKGKSDKGSPETSEPGASSSRPRRNAASMDEEELERPTRRRGRFTSSAAIKQGTVINIEDDKVKTPQDKEMVDLTREEDPSNTSDPVDQDGSVPTRNLTIQSQFPSFTLWHSDRIVDKTNDEYFKALTEWLDLSSEIHQTDLTVEGY